MRIRATAALVAVVALVGLAGCSTDSAASTVTDIGTEQLIEVAESGDVVVLDVRTPQEYAEGHVPGALNIDIASPTFAEQIGALPTDETYVVYCRSGNRSAQAAEQMVQAGFTDVYNVDAGLATLASAGVTLTQ